MGDQHRIASIEELRTIYRAPSERVLAKKTDHIGPRTRARIEASPFALLGTSAADGRCEVSPRGGPAGMLVVLDDGRVALPDLGGNNLIDSLTNIVENGHAGLLVLTPGDDETLRIEGAAHLTTDPTILDRWDGLLRRPKLAVVIEVHTVFAHCAKAFRRSGLWDPTTWPEDRVDACELFAEHTGVDVDQQELRAALEHDYAEELAGERP